MPTPPVPEITWTVTIDRANVILSIIAKRPFEEIADIIMDLRTQAAPQIQKLQQALPMMTGANMPPPNQALRANGEIERDAA